MLDWICRKAFDLDPEIKLGGLKLDLKYAQQEVDETKEKMEDIKEQLEEPRRQRDEVFSKSRKGGTSYNVRELSAQLSRLLKQELALVHETTRRELVVNRLQLQILELESKLRLRKA